MVGGNAAREQVRVEIYRRNRLDTTIGLCRVGDEDCPNRKELSKSQRVRSLSKEELDLEIPIVTNQQDSSKENNGEKQTQIAAESSLKIK